MSACGLFALALIFTSCSALDNLTAPIPTSTPTEPPLPSPTIVWFPPSATPTPQAAATQPPTPEMLPGLGDVTVTDDFSNSDLWNIEVSDDGSSAITKEGLTLAAQPGEYMFSLRKGLSLGGFYAELTARPSLCRGADRYGLLVRANAVAYYRFGVTCDRKMGAERISVGTREVLQGPIMTGDAPPGAPGQVRIGVWAVGPEMRFFLNGRHQFTIISANYPMGTVGVFVQSAGSTAAVVSFANLEIHEVDYTVPTKTPRP